MGSPLFCTALLPLLWLLCVSGIWSQELRERDALCSEDGCFVLYFQRKIFLDSWRSCKEMGGNLATVKRPEDAQAIETLLAGVELSAAQQSGVQVWIGLQRQPRQCSPTPLRGFSWITGDQDTQYTNWQQEDSPSDCAKPRCVFTGYSAQADGSTDNFKWQHGPCSVPLDAFLCRYTYKGMCPAIESEGGGNTLYSTPFNLLSSILTHVPFGSMATVPCPSGSKAQQSVLCSQREGGTVGWSREAPVCSDTPKGSYCDQDNGGCHHYCMETETHFYCECNEGFILAEDGMSCFPKDPCHDSPCQYECLPVMDSYRCACPDGSMLAPDMQGCLDVDECLQSPCEQLCVNSPGSFECRCRDGYRPDEEGACEDVDECMDEPCEHACENTAGSHICHCHLGFAPLPEDPSRCHDVDECQIKGTCEQMCINYEGAFECYCREGYELLDDHYTCRADSDDQPPITSTASYPWATGNPDSMWIPQGPVFPWALEPDSRWQIDSLDWQTEPPNMEALPTDLMLHANTPIEETENTPTTADSHASWDDLREPEEGAVILSATPTPTPDYYDEEITSVPTDPSASTVGGGAWNRLRSSSTQSGMAQWGTEEQGLFTSESGPGRNQDPPPSLPVTDGTHDDNHSEDINTSTPESLSPLPSGPIPGQGPEEASKDGSTQGEGNSWLLVALLLPLCHFILGMVVLGIMYCTRCGIQPRNKTATDCYHWISGAGDKAAADMDSGVKSHV